MHRHRIITTHLRPPWTDFYQNHLLQNLVSIKGKFGTKYLLLLKVVLIENFFYYSYKLNNRNRFSAIIHVLK